MKKQSPREKAGVPRSFPLEWRFRRDVKDSLFKKRGAVKMSGIDDAV
jgi:hypothetical protein